MNAEVNTKNLRGGTDSIGWHSSEATAARTALSVEAFSDRLTGSAGILNSARLIGGNDMPREFGNFSIVDKGRGTHTSDGEARLVLARAGDTPGTGGDTATPPREGAVMGRRLKPAGEDSRAGVRLGPEGQLFGRDGKPIGASITPDGTLVDSAIGKPIIRGEDGSLSRTDGTKITVDGKPLTADATGKLKLGDTPVLDARGRELSRKDGKLTDATGKVVRQDGSTDAGERGRRARPGGGPRSGGGGGRASGRGGRARKGKGKRKSGRRKKGRRKGKGNGSSGRRSRVAPAPVAGGGEGEAALVVEALKVAPAAVRAVMA